LAVDVTETVDSEAVCLLVLPDRLVGQPAGVTLLVAVIISSQQLVGSCDLGSDVLACLPRLLVGEGVAARRVPVVEHHACTQTKERGDASISSIGSE